MSVCVCVCVCVHEEKRGVSYYCVSLINVIVGCSAVGHDVVARTVSQYVCVPCQWSTRIMLIAGTFKMIILDC